MISDLTYVIIQIADHINAEIVTGTISSKEDAIEYLKWTYFYRRLLQNPTYYNLEDTETEVVKAYLTDLIDNTLNTLSNAGCIEMDKDTNEIAPTVMGRISSYYYLKHETMAMFSHKLYSNNDIKSLLNVN